MPIPTTIKNEWVFFTIFCNPGVALYNSARDVGLLEIIDNLYIEREWNWKEIDRHQSGDSRGEMTGSNRTGKLEHNQPETSKD
jgi:hypothetical protein